MYCTSYYHSETSCTLKFASRCRAVELGKASKNSESGDTAALRRRVAELEEQLGISGGGGGAGGGGRLRRGGGRAGGGTTPRA